MPITQPGGKRAVDRVLDASYVADLTELPVAELRRRREEADREEAWLSYVRRMLHGRIDILEGEGVITADGELDLQALIQSLAGQMGPGQYHAAVDVIESPGGGRRAVERLIDRAGLDDQAALTDEQRTQRLEQLRAMEKEVSETRSRVHDVQDLLAEELAARLKADGVDTETLQQ
ncbi:MAG: hypothetical protein V9G10_08675 [Candidatus Nanopelagicales bacterium]